MQVKLDELKVELQAMMSHWRPEWKDAVRKWSEKIVIIPSGPSSDVVILPTDSEGGHSLIELNRETLLPSFETVRDIAYPRFYHWHSRTHLGSVPINLVVDIYCHLFVEFGGKFLERKDRNTNNYSNVVQWLWLDDEHKRHRQMISQSLSSQTTDEANNIESIDGWFKLVLDEIVLGGNLRPEHYIEKVVNNLERHQVSRVIEYHFRSDARGEKIAEVAKRFSRLLRSREQGAVEIVVGLWSFPLLLKVDKVDKLNLFIIKHEDADNNNDCSLRAMKSFNLEDKKDQRHNWQNALRNSVFVDTLRDRGSDNNNGTDNGTEKPVSLTVTDVHFLLCLHIEANYDRQTSLTKVLNLDSNADADDKFPTAADNFFDFDPPHLTGLLAESILSRKLQGYALGMKEINEGKFAEVAPAALVTIVGSYYSVDVD